MYKIENLKTQMSDKILNFVVVWIIEIKLWLFENFEYFDI